MFYIALLGYFVSIYYVYKTFEPNWDATIITLWDVILGISVFILMVTPVINSAITLHSWATSFCRWADTIVLRK